MIKKILLVLLVILLIIQFIHPAKNISKGDQPYSVSKAYPVPDDVNEILGKACNDCHTNNTRYPWYSRIQPVDWWLTHHVKEGKTALNLDEYTNKSLRYQFHKMEEIAEQVKEEEMPIKSYTWSHKDAVLTENEKKILISWTEGIRNEMKSKYPEDSLKRKRN